MFFRIATGNPLLPQIAHRLMNGLLSMWARGRKSQFPRRRLLRTWSERLFSTSDADEASGGLSDLIREPSIGNLESLARRRWEPAEGVLLRYSNDQYLGCAFEVFVHRLYQS